jgi:ABC-type multidrug transport system permease subunit
MSMVSVMRRYPGTAPLVVVLVLAAGIACYLWQIHDMAQGCGYASGFGLPSFPVLTALIVLVGSPALLTGVSALIERRSRRVVAGFVLLAAVLAATAFGSALLAFFLSRGCYK